MLTGARLMTKFQVIFLVRYLVDDFVIYPFLSLQKSGFQTQKDPKQSDEIVWRATTYKSS